MGKKPSLFVEVKGSWAKRRDRSQYSGFVKGASTVFLLDGSRRNSSYVIDESAFHESSKMGAFLVNHMETAVQTTGDLADRPNRAGTCLLFVVARADSFAATR